MEIEADLSPFFGAQERSKGAELFRKELVTISSAADTDVRAYVKGSSACRVILASDEVGASTFTCTCNCPQARKGNLCKHTWAVLLKLEENGADFLNGKTQALAPAEKPNPSTQVHQAKQNEFKEALKQKAKERNKETRQRKKREERGPRFTYPAPVQESLDFFAKNGFQFDDLEMEALLNARKLLSRVFHPDKSGTLEEILELTSHFEVLQSYLES